MENHEDIQAIAEKLHEVKMKVGELFEKYELTMGEVLSLLSSMLVQTACEGGMPSLRLIEVLAKGIQSYEAQEEEDEEEEIKWLN
jgi:hypothetical protein